MVGKSSSAGSVRDSNGNWFSHPPSERQRSLTSGARHAAALDVVALPFLAGRNVLACFRDHHHHEKAPLIVPIQIQPSPSAYGS